MSDYSLIAHTIVLRKITSDWRRINLNAKIKHLSYLRFVLNEINDDLAYLEDLAVDSSHKKTLVNIKRQIIHAIYNEGLEDRKLVAAQLQQNLSDYKLLKACLERIRLQRILITYAKKLLAVRYTLNKFIKTCEAKDLTFSTGYRSQVARLIGYIDSAIPKRRIGKLNLQTEEKLNIDAKLKSCLYSLREDLFDKCMVMVEHYFICLKQNSDKLTANKVEINALTSEQSKKDTSASLYANPETKYYLRWVKINSSLGNLSWARPLSSFKM